MSQHTLWSEHDQRLAPRPERLPAQQMKILRRRGWLTNLDIVARRHLQKPLHACAGMFRPLPFIPMRQQQNQTTEQSPLVFRRCQKLVGDDLRTVGEIAKLRFPHRQCLWEYRG